MKFRDMHRGSLVLIGITLPVFVACGGSDASGDGEADGATGADTEQAAESGAALASADSPFAEFGSFDCPPDGSPGTRPAGEPVDDVIGIRPGMAFDEVLAILACRDGMTQVKVAEIFVVGETFGIPTRQLLRVADGEPCTRRDLQDDYGWVEKICWSARNRFEPLKDATDQFVVAFTGVEGEEIVGAVWRRTRFAEDARPTVSSLKEGLKEKYGEPSIDRMKQSLTPDTHELAWIYLPEGQMSGSDWNYFDVPHLNRSCFRTVNPEISRPQEFSHRCGLTIRAEVRQSGNPQIAESMEVVIADQREFVDATRAFEAELANAYEQRVQGGAGPDL